MDELSLYEHILSISTPWFVEHIDLDKPTNTVHVYVQYDSDTSLECPCCSRQVTRYDSRKRSWRHLDTCQFQTIVHCDVPRSDCPEHGVLLIEVPWAEKGGRYTLMFEALVIDWLKEASINAVSRRLSVSWNAIDGIMKRGLDRRSDMDTSHLAVDEVNRKKGHKYMTIVSNDQGYVLDVQEGKGKEGLSLYFKGLSLLTRTNIKTISMELSPAFRAVALEYIPGAKNKICFDKFHIAQDLNKAVDAVRKSEIKNVDKIIKLSEQQLLALLGNEQELNQLKSNYDILYKNYMHRSHNQFNSTPFMGKQDADENFFFWNKTMSDERPHRDIFYNQYKDFEKINSRKEWHENTQSKVPTEFFPLQSEFWEDETRGKS